MQRFSIVTSIGSLLIVGVLLLIPQGQVISAIESVILLAMSACVLVGLKRNAPRARFGWYAMSATAAATSGIVAPRVVPMSIEAYDYFDIGFSLLAAVLALTGYISIVRHRNTGGWRMATFLDSSILIVAASLLISEALPVKTASNVDLVRIGLFFGAALMVGMFAALARLFTEGSYRLGASRQLALFVVFGIVAFVLDAPPGPTKISDMFLILTIMSMGSAALHPSMRLLSEPRETQPSTFKMRQAMLICAALVVSPTVATLNNVRGKTNLDVLWLACSIALAVFVGIRIKTLLNEREQARNEIAVSEMRTRSLADLGGLVMGSRNLSEVVELVTEATHQASELATIAFASAPNDSLLASVMRGFNISGDEVVSVSTADLGIDIDSPFGTITRGNCPDGHPSLLWSAEEFLALSLIGENNAITVIVMYGKSQEIAKIQAPITDFLRQISHIVRLFCERNDAERDLRQAQKLDAVGHLAAGVAHEINTPIQFIGDNLRFLSETFPQFEDNQNATVDADEIEFLKNEIPRAIEQSLDGVEQVSTIVRAMKAFSDVDSHQSATATDLNQALRDTLTVATFELRPIHSVETHFGDIPTAICMAGEMNQVLLNLVTNAAHAIVDKYGEGNSAGKLTIRTEHSDGAISIWIADNGNGIPEQIQHRVWEQFFTTKEVGRGTGQGLSISKAIAERHQGTLNFETSSDGTTFVLKLPVVAAAQVA